MASARLTVVVDLPTPPLPEATATMCLISCKPSGLVSLILCPINCVYATPHRIQRGECMEIGQIKPSALSHGFV